MTQKTNSLLDWKTNSNFIEKHIFCFIFSYVVNDDDEEMKTIQYTLTNVCVRVFGCVVKRMRNEWKKSVQDFIQYCNLYIFQMSVCNGRLLLGYQMRLQNNYVFDTMHTHTQTHKPREYNISRLIHFTILCTHKIMHAFLMNLYIYYQIKSNQ